MSGDSSEEKTLPPSKKKLDDARKKGQVAQSKDMVGAATLCAGLGGAWLATGAMFVAGAAMLDAAGNAASLGLGPGLRALGTPLQNAFIMTSAPVFALVVVAAILGNIVVLKGVVFSVEPVAPKMSNINPAEGFKKLFKMKQLIELVKSLLKMVLLTVALGVVLYGGLRPLALSPSCGLDCVFLSSKALALVLMGTSAVVFIVAGGLDVLLQRWLFMRDQKMGVSEQKREHKEQEGDPHIKAQRKRTMREGVDGPSKLGARQASIMVHDGAGSVVGLRFIRGEMPVPMVVCRARGERGVTMIKDAISNGTPVTKHADLAQGLARGAPPGAYIPEATYQAAAAVLSQHGLV